MVADKFNAVDQQTYDGWLNERKRLREWETFIVEFVSGARRLQAKQPHVPEQVLVDNIPSKRSIIESAQREDMTTYWRDVRKEVVKLTKLSLVNQWFGIPVKESAWGADPNNWARYSAKVPNPMDLRTVAEKLGESGIPTAYSSPDQVTADIRLIVSNCEVFNEGDAGDQVCKVARQLQNTWERRWQPDDGTGLHQRWDDLCIRHKAENKALKWLQAAPAGQGEARLREFDNKVQQCLDEDPPPPVASVGWELRRKVATRIAQLNWENAAHVMQILEHLQPRAIRGASRTDCDAVLDMNTLSQETLEKLQLFLDHLPIRKGKEDKKKRAVVKGKDGKFRSAAAAAANTAPTTGPSTAPASGAPSGAASGAPSGHNSGATTPNAKTPNDHNDQPYHLSQSCLDLGPEGMGDLSASEGADMVMHDMSLHDRPLLDDPMHDVIDVS
eukprot:jgi/Ulvmu1/7713/UM039_0019.1